MAVQSVKPAAAPREVEQAQSHPITLQQAADAIERDFKKWSSCKAPTYAEWSGIARRLANAERAVAGLLGVNSVLRQHHFSSEGADECDGEYAGITGFQAGSLGDAQEALTWLIYDQLIEARDSIASEA